LVGQGNGSKVVDFVGVRGILTEEEKEWNTKTGKLGWVLGTPLPGPFNITYLSMIWYRSD
jgi:hypothetical protein